jgi:hypothetical protein
MADKLSTHVRTHTLIEYTLYQDLLHNSTIQQYIAQTRFLCPPVRNIAHSVPYCLLHWLGCSTGCFQCNSLKGM